MHATSRHSEESEHQVRVKEVARNFIDEAVMVLTEERVLPTSIYQRFVTVGRDYEGSHLMQMNNYKIFEQILQQSYPIPFTDPQSTTDPQFPTTYIFSFLEAFIARSGAEGMYDSRSEGFEISFKEMIDLLDSNKYEIVCCREVSHLETEHNSPITFGDLSVIPVLGARESIIDKLVPGARGSFYDKEPRIYNPPLAVIVAKQFGESQDPYKLAADLEAKIDNFLLILRLLYATTADSHWQVTGASTLVSRIHPAYKQYRMEWLGPALIRRVIRLSGENWFAIDKIQELLGSAQVARKGLATNTIDLALERFKRTYVQSNPFDKIVDLCIALEAILIGDGNETEGISLRLKTRAAALLQTEHDSAPGIFDDITTFYNLRSQIVHGGQIRVAKLFKDIRRISTVPEQGMFGTATVLAVDRLQDLVRRAILARLCLASDPRPLWSFNKPASVDSVLSDPAMQSQWRNHWHQKMTDLGAGESAGESIPAIDLLGASGD